MSGVLGSLGGLALLVIGLELLARHGGQLAARWLAAGDERRAWQCAPLLVLLQSPTTAQSLVAAMRNSGQLQPATAFALVCTGELGPLLSLWLGVAAAALGPPALAALALCAALLAGRREALRRPACALLAGAGCALLGLHTAQAGMAALAAGWSFPEILRLGPLAALVWMGLGIALGLLTRVPAAIAALAVVATGTGLLPLAGAGCTLVGSSLAAALLALLQSLHNASGARRLAQAHAGAGLLLALVQLALLPLLLLAEESLPGPWGPGLRLALLATAAVLLWGALLTPLAPNTGLWLGQRLESLRQPRPSQLDGHGARHPALAEPALEEACERLAGLHAEAVEAHWLHGGGAGEGGWQRVETLADALDTWLEEAVAAPDGGALLPWRERWAPLALFARQQPPADWPAPAELPPEAHDARYRHHDAARRALASCRECDRDTEGMWEALEEKRLRLVAALVHAADAGQLGAGALAGELARTAWLDAALQAARQAGAAQ